MTVLSVIVGPILQGRMFSFWVSVCGAFEIRKRLKDFLYRNTKKRKAIVSMDVTVRKCIITLLLNKEGLWI